MKSVRNPGLLTLLASILIIMVAPDAHAHSGEGLGGGFLSGFTHPILGWDHVAAMVAVGLWGAFLRSPGIWVLPVVFPLVMAIGAAAGAMGMPLPGVEIGIALSSIVLGLLILAACRLPLWVAIVIVSCFAVFHGHAHGTELPGSVNPMSYALGFVISTGLLHLAGIGLGLLVTVKHGPVTIRAAGGIIALAGLGFLLGSV